MKAQWKRDVIDHWTDYRKKKERKKRKTRIHDLHKGLRQNFVWYFRGLAIHRASLFFFFSLQLVFLFENCGNSGLRENIEKNVFQFWGLKSSLYNQKVKLSKFAVCSFRQLNIRQKFEKNPNWFRCLILTFKIRINRFHEEKRNCAASFKRSLQRENFHLEDGGKFSH